jgi:hypothetical protein
MDLLKANKKELASYAKRKVESYFSNKVSAIKRIGGGSFGVVFKLKMDSEPCTVIYKFCKKEGMAPSETYALKFFSENTAISQSIFFQFCRRILSRRVLYAIYTRKTGFFKL